MITSWLSLQAGVTLQRSHYKEAEKWSQDENIPAEKKMFRTPNTYGYFTSTVTPVKRFTASLSGTYTGSMLVQHLAGYIPADQAIKTPNRDSSYIYGPATPRNYFAGIKISY